jgi:hypothetical protein
VLSTLGVATIAFLLSYREDASATTTLLLTAKAGGIWLVVFGIYHLTRSPWKFDLKRQKEVADLDMENKKLEKNLAEVFAGPKFSGHFYQFQIFSRTGAVDPNMVHQASNLASGRSALDPSDPPKFDYDIFIEMYLQNDAPARGSILEYVFEMEVDGIFLKLDREFSFKGWILEREESHMNAKDFLTVVKKRAQKPVVDLSEAAPAVWEQKDAVEGWLHYFLKDVAYTEFKGKKHDMRFTVHDGNGKSHSINVAWTGEPRPWRIGHDFSA